MQKALTDLGYDTQGADSKFGNNTLSAVHIVGGYAAVQRWDGTKWTTYKSFYFDKYDTDSSSFSKTYSAEAGYRRITNVKPSADFLKGTVLHIVQLHDLRIIGRILAQRLYENIGNKNSAQIIIRAECYFGSIPNFV